MKIAHLIGSSVFDAAFFEQVVAAHQADEQVFIGVDRGTVRLLETEHPIDLALGDYDSISAEARAQVKARAKAYREFRPEKDLTDTEEALDALLADFPLMDRYYFHAMLGGRLDHTLHNIWLANNPKYATIFDRFWFVSPNNLLSFYQPGSYTIAHWPGMKYLSFTALEPVLNLSLENVKYPLAHYNMPFAQSFISNEFLTESMTLTFDAGKLIMMQTRD